MDTEFTGHCTSLPRRFCSGRLFWAGDGRKGSGEGRGPLPGAGLAPGDRASKLEPLEAWAFSNEMGGPLNTSNPRQRVFHRCLAKASLRRIRLHDLRHTYASILLGRGESPVSVKEQMGHHSIKVAVDTRAPHPSGEQGGCEPAGPRLGRNRPQPPRNRNKKGTPAIRRNPLTCLVELTGFEPVTS